ncbi:YdcF family protein [Tropicibacter naphthalenivorans]|uniref:YdcF family protein n=1 Tax=Tropicibacter naphthalenivorans TaxID=441103 RepID=UPI001F1E98D8|nr:YdcF family protein [Tropicibacter naphthalenivorans]
MNHGPVALVLGAAVWQGGRASPSLRRRAGHAAQLWLDGKVRAIVVSGGVGLHPPSEAQVMAAICIEAGVPEGAVFREEQATNTWENIERSRALLERIGAREVVIVTDGYHAPRARMMARRMGLEARSDCPRRDYPLTWGMVKLRLREAMAYLYTWSRGFTG